MVSGIIKEHKFTLPDMIGLTIRFELSEKGGQGQIILCTQG